VVDNMFILAHAIDIEELQRLVALCETRDLPVEAERIRRWLGDVPPMREAVQ